jgi:hypothetical protein
LTLICNLAYIALARHGARLVFEGLLIQKTTTRNEMFSSG